MTTFLPNILPMNLEPDYSAATYLVTDKNKEPYDAIHAWPHWPSHMIGLYGVGAAGKTHLGKIWAEKNHIEYYDMRYTTLEGFLAREAKHLCLDFQDINISWPKAEEEFFLHLINKQQQEHKTLLCISRLPLTKWQADLPDLASRIKSCWVYEVTPLSDEELSYLYMKLFHDAQIIVDVGVVHYLLQHYDRNPQSIQDIVKRLNKFAWERQRKVSIPLIKEFFAKMT